MRTKNTMKNIIMNFVNNILLNILKYISRIIFVKVLDEILLGVNGLLSNVLGILALSELGVGTAISYCLYKPLVDKDEEKIKSLMKFYKKAYRVIAIVVLVLGLALLPFLPSLINDNSGIDNLNIIYLIFLFNMVIGYLFSYKRTLISADQKNYKIVPITILYNFITTVLQIIALLVFKNYFVYLLIQSITIILENITVNHYINKQYSYLNDMNSAEKLDKKELSVIKTKIKALMFHKFGGYVVSGTDNIIISKFIGLAAVGLYSNYLLVINMIYSFAQIIFNNVIPSFGNLVVKENYEKRLKTFKEMNFICYFIFGVSTICLINLLSPFISLSFGENFVLSKAVVILVVVNFYLTGMTNIPNMVQTASGLYEKDKYMPILQSIINIVVSIWMVIKIGLPGVFIGTVVSSFIPMIIKPIVIYKNVFNSSVKEYFKEYIFQMIIIIILYFVTNSIISVIHIDNQIIDFIVRAIISGGISALAIIAIYYRTNRFKSIIERIKKILKRKDGVIYETSNVDNVS